MGTVLYRTLLHPLFWLALRVVSLWSPKARRGVLGRRAWREQLGAPPGADDKRYRVHFHAASVGEFEQAKPIIEALRADRHRYRITASFFSPSGYEQQGGYPALDASCYLPPDRAAEMTRFFDLVAPDVVIIIRYDLWLEFLREASRRKVPVVLVCGVLREGSARFRPGLRGFFSTLYGMLSLIHAVGEEDRSAFRALVPQVELETSGDTRYDRVMARAAAAAEIAGITPELIAGRVVLVCGSTWPPDEELLQSLAWRPDLLLVLVPHEPTEDHVAGLLRRFAGSATLSQIEAEQADGAVRAVVVDRTGILSALYRIGGLAYVGGAFGEGVHSVLEPAAYGIPVICGPGIHRSRDAEEMYRDGALFVVNDGAELARQVHALVEDVAKREEVGNRVRWFVKRRVGATDRVIASLRVRQFLPSQNDL